jgi:dTDP-4-dehydrorhamnose 3,5-epimerase
VVEPIRDPATVTPDGESLAELPDGVTFREAVTHVDSRGSVTELFDERWDWHPDPLVFCYVFTVRPKQVKGWGMHLEHEDRYFVLFGELSIVMYDAREGSPTRGLVATVVLSEYRRRLMNVPTGVWHANHNIGDRDAVCINFPTRPYDHESPDKYRLPLDTEEIPYHWPGDALGW